MQYLKSNLYPCAHCMGTGTCSNGQDSYTCAICIKAHELKLDKEHFGLPCSVCSGIGQAETRTEIINKRMQSVVAISVVIFLFSMIFFALLGESQYFSQILTFSSTLLGIILVSYFSKNRM